MKNMQTPEFIIKYNCGNSNVLAKLINSIVNHSPLFYISVYISCNGMIITHKIYLIAEK